jgi:hypothetical protein
MQYRGMINGYTRVSAGVQDSASHVARLAAARCERVFSGKVTGITADHPRRRKLMALLSHHEIVFAILGVAARLGRTEDQQHEALARLAECETQHSIARCCDVDQSSISRLAP